MEDDEIGLDEAIHMLSVMAMDKKSDPDTIRDGILVVLGDVVRLNKSLSARVEFLENELLTYPLKDAEPK